MCGAWTREDGFGLSWTGHELDGTADRTVKDAGGGVGDGGFFSRLHKALRGLPLDTVADGLLKELN